MSEQEGISVPQTVARYRIELVREAPPVPYEEPLTCSRPAAVARFLQLYVVNNCPFEVMGALFFDQRQRVTGYCVPYSGTISRIMVEPRGLLLPAWQANASGIVAFHNHPSGDPTPSAEDLALTRRLVDAGEVVGVTVHDHLILGEMPHFVSLREKGEW